MARTAASHFAGIRPLADTADSELALELKHKARVFSACVAGAEASYTEPRSPLTDSLLARVATPAAENFLTQSFRGRSTHTTTLAGGTREPAQVLWTVTLPAMPMRGVLTTWSAEDRDGFLACLLGQSYDLFQALVGQGYTLLSPMLYLEEPVEQEDDGTFLLDVTLDLTALNVLEHAVSLLRAVPPKERSSYECLLAWVTCRLADLPATGLPALAVDDTRLLEQVTSAHELLAWLESSAAATKE